MIVSDSHRFVFVHNPKAGGMTFRTALMPYETRGNKFFEWQRVGHKQARIDMAHITLQQLRTYFPEVLDQVAPYYKFGFVRDPYARFFSALSQHLKQGSAHLRLAVLSEPDLFYRIAAAFARACLTDRRLWSDFKLVHFRRQSDFFYLGELRWADGILKLEDAAAEIAASPAAAWLGDAALTVRNRTEGYETGYDAARLAPDARAIVEDFYAPDFERFGYPRL